MARTGRNARLENAARAPAERDEKHAAIAGYIAQMSGELGALAAGSGLDMLAYLLEMARVEADSIALSDPRDSQR